MFWLGMLIGGITGGTLGVFLMCIIIVGKEADNREHFNEHTIK